MKIRGKTTILIASWMAMGSLVMWMPTCVQGSPESNVTLSLQSDPPEADVSPGSSGLVTISGNVSCTTNGTKDVKVILNGHSDLGHISIFPSRFYFEGDNDSWNTRSFRITSRVPQGYIYDEPLRLSIAGQFIEDNFTYPISDIVYSIETQPYYNIKVDAPLPQEIGAGEFVYFKLKITNTGNSEDTYEFIFDNLSDLCGQMWTIATITPKSFGIGQTQTVVFSAQAPQTWSLWRNEIQPFHLRILSMKARETGGDVKCFVRLYVRQRGSYIPGFAPSFALFGIIFVSLVLGKKKMMDVKGKPPEYPKDLYSELSMSIR
jgi:hypothetical protein